MSRMLDLVLIFAPLLLAQEPASADNGVGVSGEGLATLALCFLLAASGIYRQKIRADEDKHLALDVSKTGVLDIPPKLPETKFRPSRKELKDNLGWWSVATGGGGMAGSAADYLDLGFFDFPVPADVATDGTIGGGLIGAVGFIGFFLIDKYRRRRCPYCRRWHAATTKVCPNTDLPLWLSVQFLVDKDKVNYSISDAQAVGELIAQHYYPYPYSTALKVAPLVWELILLSQKAAPPLGLDVVKQELVSSEQIKTLIRAAEFLIRSPAETEKRIERVLNSKVLEDKKSQQNQIDEEVKKSQENKAELYRRVFRELTENQQNKAALYKHVFYELRIDADKLRDALKQLGQVDQSRIEEELEYLNRIEEVLDLLSKN